MIDLEWMAWTPPTASFFAAIGVILVGMTVWQLRSPTSPRRGFLPMTTTRGDRLFVGLLATGFLHLGWVGLTDLSLWIALGLSAVLLVFVLRFG